MNVSELKKKLRPLFKDRLKGMHGGWNNVKSVLSAFGCHQSLA